MTGGGNQRDFQRTRVDVVGSFLRPPALKDAYADYERGVLAESELRDLQDESIRAVVAEQEARGLPMATDGEFRRRHFMESFADVAGYADTGLTPVEPLHGQEQAEKYDEPSRERTTVVRRNVVERLRLVRNRPLEEYEFLRDIADLPGKVSLIGPDRIAQRADLAAGVSAYGSTEEFLADVVAVERRIVAALVGAGCRYVHIDEPGYTAYADERALSAMRSRGEDPQASLARSIAADNAVIEGFPGTFGVHLCRGNRRSQWHREGHYDAIAEQLFTGLRHDRLLLEYDTERAGGFEPLRFVPKDKVVVLGLITTKVGDIETVDELKRRIEAATQYISIDQLALSPQCGFASELAGNLLSEDAQWRKLDVMLETAAQVWE